MPRSRTPRLGQVKVIRVQGNMYQGLGCAMRTESTPCTTPLVATTSADVIRTPLTVGWLSWSRDRKRVWPLRAWTRCLLHQGVLKMPAEHRLPAQRSKSFYGHLTLADSFLIETGKFQLQHLYSFCIPFQLI